MQRQVPSQQAPIANRRGFTLVELLIVIAIIALLAAILVPTLAGVTRRAREAQVRQEISQLETAITAFKTAYGIEPPSRFVLYEDLGDYLVTDADPVRDALRLKSKDVITQMWPQFAFSGTVDWDSGARTGPYYLNGSECLIFFLGGIIEPGTSPPNLKGFSKNPRAPFSAVGDSREGPFMEFAASRVKDQLSGSSNEGLDGRGVLGIPEYVDPLGGQVLPYIYLSSYRGKGYDPGDVPVVDFDNPALEGSQMRDGAYLISDTSSAFYKPQTFQIISPGVDTKYGHGGVYEEEDLGHDDQNNLLSDNTIHSGPGDQDNITNFAQGRLRP